MDANMKYSDEFDKWFEQVAPEITQHFPKTNLFIAKAIAWTSWEVSRLSALSPPFPRKVEAELSEEVKSLLLILKVFDMDEYVILEEKDRAALNRLLPAPLPTEGVER